MQAPPRHRGCVARCVSETPFRSGWLVGGAMPPVELMYGRGRVQIDIDDDVEVVVVEKPPMPLLPDPKKAVENAIEEPTAAAASTGWSSIRVPPLRTLAQGKQTACILICDITRPVPNGLTLPILVRALLDAGVPASGITVLVATGLHRPNEGEELAELVGDPWVLETVSCVNHFAREDADHVHVGTTSRGTVVRLDRRFVEAELRIATGLVEPHFMAGYSGGRKVISPGIAHAETITTFHSARFMENAKAVEGNLDGNPLHEDQLEIVAMLDTAANPILGLNVVIDDARRLAFVSYGHIIPSHESAVEFVRDFAVVPVPGPRFSTVVTSSAGYPLDKTCKCRDHLPNRLLRLAFSPRFLSFFTPLSPLPLLLPLSPLSRLFRELLLGRSLWPC